MFRFETEVREIFDKKYLKVFINDISKIEKIQTLLSKLQTVSKVNIPESNNNQNVNLTVYPRKPYTVNDCKNEVDQALNDYVRTKTGTQDVLSKTMQEYTGEDNGDSNIMSQKNSSPVVSKDVFIVHGHDKDMISSVVDFLQSLGLNPIILGEQANKGKTLIEKFESNAQKVDFAVILMSKKDDKGRKCRARKEQPRARQNVILELGYFMAKLGREHIFVLKYPEVEAPSDIFGLVYTKYDKFGEWKDELKRELKTVFPNL